MLLKKGTQNLCRMIRYKSFAEKPLCKNTPCLILSIIRKKGSGQNSLLTKTGFFGIIIILISAGFFDSEFVEYDANAIFAA